VADVHAALGATIANSEPRKAKVLLEKALEHALALVKTSPTTLLFLHNAANTHYSLAVPLHALGEHHAAIAHLQSALKLQRDVADSVPNQPGLRHNLMDTLNRLASVHLDLSESKEAEAVLKESLQIAATVARDAAFPSKIPAIATIYSNLGRLHAMTRSGQSGECFEKSLALWDELKGEGISAQYLNAHRAPVEKALRAGVH
jgi:tetratricopeptide (TPR) repeat protein